MKKILLLVGVALLLSLATTGCQSGSEKSGAPSSPATPAEEKPSPPRGEHTSQVPGCEGVNIEGVPAVPPPSGEKPEDGDMLVRQLDAEPATLNPMLATDIYEQMVNYYVMESLLDMDLETGELKPLLAESYEVSEDHLTFTFHLRKDVVFHDGDPFTAEDVIFSIDRIKDPKVDAAQLRAYFLDCESYEALDDYTVRVKWKKPYFKALETVGGIAVLPRHILDDGTDFNKHPFARHPVGTGPYRFEEWKTGQSIRLVRCDRYWGQRPHFDAILFKIITNEDVALQVLKKGDLDLIERLNRVQWVKQTSSPSFQAKFHKLRYNYPSFSFIGWNLRHPLFADKRVRQAMTMLLNREAMVREIFYCLADIASGPFYFKTPYSNPEIKPWPYDPGRARALLAEAGFADTDGDGILDKEGKKFSFELSFTADVPEWEQMAVIYREDLKKAGIEMRIRKLEWAVFAENVDQGKFEAYAMGLALEANPDPYPLWHSSQADVPGSFNRVYYQNPEVDQLIEKLRAEFDREKRIEYCRAIHRIIHEDQPYTFFLTGQRLSVVDKRIHNIFSKPLRPCLNYIEWYVPKARQKYVLRATP